jgi:bifunctional UDP-N-acetylglucosamine pyrophosphorylase/glucosamine-1-phosphate N-acetyltransferase
MTGQGSSAAAAIVLAAGKGTRMKTDLPKVAVRMGGRPLLHYVLDATFGAGVANVIVVTGYQRDVVSKSLSGYAVREALQAEQKGTGHAVQMAAPLLEGHDGPVVVLAGDIPLIRPGTIARLLERHAATRAAVTVLTAELEDASGYGRIVRNAEGRVTGIVEERDADDAVRRIREINSSIYAFDWRFLAPALGELRDENAQGEYYLTDTVHLAVERRLRVEAILVDDPREVSGVNTVEQLAELEAAARAMGLIEGGTGA